MNQQEAKKEILKLARAGHPYDEIQAMMHAAGYVSPRTGKPIGSKGIQVIAHKAGIRRRNQQGRKKAVEHAPTQKPPANQLDAIRALLTAKSIPPQKRIELALMVMK